MTYHVWIAADYDTKEEAERALSALNEVVGTTNGDLQDDGLEDLDG